MLCHQRTDWEMLYQRIIWESLVYKNLWISLPTTLFMSRSAQVATQWLQLTKSFVLFVLPQISYSLLALLFLQTHHSAWRNIWFITFISDRFIQLDNTCEWRECPCEAERSLKKLLLWGCFLSAREVWVKSGLKVCSWWIFMRCWWEHILLFSLKTRLE